jgi:hypothetical protein
MPVATHRSTILNDINQSCDFMLTKPVEDSSMGSSMGLSAQMHA